MLSVAVGGPTHDYSPRGINGPLDQLLFPITHGSLYFPGFDVMPTYALYCAGNVDAEGMAAAKDAWRARLDGLFDDAPIPFRPQAAATIPISTCWPPTSPSAKAVCWDTSPSPSRQRLTTSMVSRRELMKTIALLTRRADAAADACARLARAALLSIWQGVAGDIMRGPQAAATHAADTPALTA